VTPLILPFRGRRPQIDPAAWLAPGAVAIGDVLIGRRASIWYGCILRGDVSSITIGENSNVQDGTVVHVSTGKPGTRIGANVTIGHMALIHACVLEDGSFVGMKACIADGAVVESGAMVAAGALVTPGKRVKAGELWGGNPAKFMRLLTEQEKAYIAELPGRYVALAEEHRAGLAAE
jgi:carbonic anhydrase/acetyltransferase-like protein (isoleucine patch superfamily)